MASAAKVRVSLLDLCWARSGDKDFLFTRVNKEVTIMVCWFACFIISLLAYLIAGWSFLDVRVLLCCCAGLAGGAEVREKEC